MIGSRTLSTEHVANRSERKQCSLTAKYVTSVFNWPEVSVCVCVLYVVFLSQALCISSQPNNPEIALFSKHSRAFLFDWENCQETWQNLLPLGGHRDEQVCPPPRPFQGMHLESAWECTGLISVCTAVVRGKSVSSFLRQGECHHSAGSVGEWG